MQVAGDIYVFGDGDCGQLGLGEDVTERLRPYPLQIEHCKFIQIACGGMHTVALSADGEVFSWGVNDEGALGRETGGELWEKSEKSTGVVGDPYVPGKVEFPKGTDRVVQISAGDSHTVALTDYGKVWAWGTYRDSSGVMGFSLQTRIQLTPICVYTPTSQDNQVVRIASGADHTVALTRTGTLMSWGNGQQGQLGRTGERLSDRVRMSTLLTPHKVFIKKSRGMASTRIVDVACGTYDVFALTATGNVLAWGLNNYGQLGLASAAPIFSPTLIQGITDASILRPGQHHTLVVTNSGSIVAFGRPTYGRLGRKDADVHADSACPDIQPVDGLEGVKIVGAAAGLAVSGCFDEIGNGWMWGFGTSNQLGKGDDDEDEIVPRKLAETKLFQGKKIVQMEFGGQHVALLVVDRKN